ncbi:MAG: putative cytochrome P450 hydroxylase [uncultured Solirubrobacteraceae bacterium]|uniref:Putative cytochrome P450 hydroxylase n=1 Tax=uncultured Solirubrobacteraceae bacterium TaxID=1162706 RepID=A0A6J4RXT0_9ACTN|nr:MAG: putative cytochrome P450 hydroxylase [uncultured Solirubrobacteraceae bacterium]
MRGGFPLGAALTAEALEAPHAALRTLREREPVSWVPALGGWLVTRRDLALAVMRDPAAFTVDDPRFTTARVVGPSMLSLDGAEHQRHRAAFARPFRRDEVLRRFSDPVAAEADRLIDGFGHAGAVELRRAFAGPLATAVVVHALGLHGADTAAVAAWYESIVAEVTALSGGGAGSDDGRAAVARLSAAVGQALDADAASLVGDAAAEDTGLARDEVIANAAVLLFGGIETTEGMIANAVLHLLAHPGELARVRAEPALLVNAIEESLRLEPAAARVDRYATRDVRLGDASISARDLVVVSVTAANRDPATFPDPDAFDAGRENARRHLAFAAGPHVCVAMHLARLEAHTGVERLLARLPGLRLDPAAADMEPRGLVFRKPPALRVRWDPG